ncbi:MAG: hypothetical protein IJE44_02850 [Clostridia bacterium]|nr:hypothetical protein [Clostridia bacterium]
MKKFFEKDSVLKIASFLIALLIWLYVVYIEDPEITRKIDDIPVSYKVTELPDSLAMVDYNIKTIDIKIKGERSELIAFDKEDISAFLDLSVVSESGKYDNIKIDVSTSNKNIEIVERSDKKSQVQIDTVVSSFVDVSAEIIKDAPKGYSVSEKPILFLDSVRVSGAKTYVDMVESAYVAINCEELTESKTVSSKVVLVDKNGKDIVNGHIAYKNLTVSDEEISAYVTISKDESK